MRITRISLALLGALAACRSDAARQLDAALVRYNGFVRHMQGDSIAAMYAPDGELVVRGRGTLRGPDSIRTFLASFTNVTVDSAAMWGDSVRTTDSGVVQWGGFYQQATVTGRAPVTATGRFVSLWKREPGGRWALRRMQTY